MKLQMNALVYEYRPPVNNFCFHTKPFALINQFWTCEQYCDEDGKLTYKRYNWDDFECSGDYQIMPNDPTDPNGFGVNGDCAIQNHLCDYSNTNCITKISTYNESNKCTNT